MRQFLVSDLFTPNGYAELIVEVASRMKSMECPAELNYNTIIREIATWVEDLFGLRMPRLSQLVELTASAFILVMKAKRMKVDVDNYQEFLECLRADLYRELYQRIKNSSAGIKTKYEIKK